MDITSIVRQVGPQAAPRNVLVTWACAHSCPGSGLWLDPSCQSKRAALFAERVSEQIALPVVHRHIVFTIPKAIRGLFQRERKLLGLLSRCAYEAVRRAYAAYLEDRSAVPGFIASIQTFGSYAIDAILSHIRQKGGRDPFEGRGPPATGPHAAGMAG